MRYLVRDLVIVYYGRRLAFRFVDIAINVLGAYL